MPGLLATTVSAVPTMVPGDNKHRVIGHREEREVRELVSFILQTGHGRGGQGVSVLRQRVQHFAIHIAAHQVANQLYLTGVVWGFNALNCMDSEKDWNGKCEKGYVEEGGQSGVRGLRMVGK